MIFVFFKGLILGLAIAIPVGPIGVLCIRRTLVMGQLNGLVSGLGAATADGIYGCIAGFGLTAVADLLASQAFWLRLVGGLFLCYLGISTILAKPPSPKAPEEGSPSQPFNASLLGAYGSTLALTLTNPATIFSFAAIFAGVGLVESGQNYAASGILVLGVFLGSALWWCVLSATVNLLRSRLTPARMRWLNRVSGGVITIFGVLALTVRG
ncbi:MAG: LysE/ArgO family amino acid transporter [Leptolyngbyaceae cyanobacterium]